jgi:hypothetical protein
MILFFSVSFTKHDWTPYIEFYFGNPQCKPRPCIHITLEPQDPIAIINTCSISEKSFNRGTGAMVIFIKTVLKWMIKEYPFIQTFSFTDESYFKTKDGTYLLPEKMLLTEGKTWYQKHFNATPSVRTLRIYNSYLLEHQRNGDIFKNLPKNAWLESQLAETLKSYSTLAYKTLSGTEWYISRDMIESYDTPPFELISTIIKGGRLYGKQKQKQIVLPPRPWSILKD